MRHGPQLGRLPSCRSRSAGLVDSATAPRVGRLVGASHLVVGRVTDRGNAEFGIDVRIANTVDGRVERALAARAPVRDILAAVRTLALRMYDAFGVVLTPAERAAVEQGPAPTLAALLAYGSGLRDESRGDVASAALHYDDAARLDRAFAGARARVAAGRVEPERAVRAGAARDRVAARLSATVIANGAVNGSPISTLAAGIDAMMTTGMMSTGMIGTMPGMTASATGGMTATTAQAQNTLQDRALMGQAQAAFATVVVRLRTVP